MQEHDIVYSSITTIVTSGTNPSMMIRDVLKCNYLSSYSMHDAKIITHIIYHDHIDVLSLLYDSNNVVYGIQLVVGRRNTIVNML